MPADTPAWAKGHGDEIRTHWTVPAAVGGDIRYVVDCTVGTRLFMIRHGNQATVSIIVGEWGARAATVVVQTKRIDQTERVVKDVGVAVPALGIRRINGGEAGWVGGGPATLRGILAVKEIIVACRSVGVLAGEG